jgi:transposase
MPTMTQPALSVFGGVDTHLDTHTAAVIDDAGRLLDTAEFDADTAGYQALLAWLRGFGSPVRVGVEGTGAYGAGLTRSLRSASVTVVEIDRPDRKTRRWQGKSDPVDAQAAARTALSAHRTSTPKTRDGQVEALRNLRVARRSAVSQRADTQRRIKALIVTCPDTLRARLRTLPDRQLIATCAAARPDPTRANDPTTAVRLALRTLARRHQHLSTEINELDTLIGPLVAALNPRLLARKGIGPDVAGQLLVTAGDNPTRMRSEAAFAMLIGAAPLPASSGKTHRHRLNRGGDRAANNAVWRIVITRMATDPATRTYVQRRTTEGLSKPEIIRCLKRYVAREIYQLLANPQPTTNDLATAA